MQMKNDPLVGTHLGSYRIHALLGEGGMARVYKASHDRLQREVAIKIILPEAAGDVDFQRRFEQEAQLIASLQHRNIVAVYDFGESRNIIYLVMQYVGGGTLRDQLSNGEPLEPRRAALYMLQMARALQHAHQQGIVHRDVKPLNMLVSATNRNELLLSDFGLAKLFARNADTLLAAHDIQNRGTDHAVSVAGGIMGTPRYMAPEQCLSKPVDARTDVYALGVVLFEILTGRPLFQGETVLSLLRQHAYEPAPSVHEVNPLVPEALALITARALAKPPEERYQSAKDMALALEAFLSPPTPVLRSAPSPRPRLRRNALNDVVTGVFLVLALTAQILFSRGLMRWPILAVPSSTQNTPYTPSCGLAQAATQAQPFVETFQDNQRHWQSGDGSNLTASVDRHTYRLATTNKGSSLYFLCPASSSVGTLPANFSLAIQMTQVQGSSDTPYGIGFRLLREGNTTNVSGYGFVITAHGTWAILKYDSRSAGGPTQLAYGTNTSAIHDVSTSNTLRVSARGGSMSFKINDVLVSTLNDASYTGGELGILVSGPNTSFAVTSVTLTIS
ncbi:MAG: serine/threonine protein kinase [Ktedonobacteraceae bacterium]|nr:serine/threonine protein kinase [Ktedonobacteraceae bacterium]